MQFGLLVMFCAFLFLFLVIFLAANLCIMVKFMVEILFVWGK